MTSPSRTPTTAFQDFIMGFKSRCPNCEKGKLFKSYLKVTDQCSECGEEYHHHRADDLPAYYVILIVGHIIVTLALSIEAHFHPAYWVHLLLWGPSTIILALLLLQPVKGGITALQWRMGMHGFKHAKQIRDQNLAE